MAGLTRRGLLRGAVAAGTMLAMPNIVGAWASGINMATLDVPGKGTMPTWDGTNASKIDDWIAKGWAESAIRGNGAVLDYTAVNKDIGTVYGFTFPDRKVDLQFSGQRVFYNSLDGSMFYWANLGTGMRSAGPEVFGHPRCIAIPGKDTALAQVRNCTNPYAELWGTSFNKGAQLHNTAANGGATEQVRMKLNLWDVNYPLWLDPDNGSGSFSCLQLDMFVHSMVGCTESSPTVIYMVGASTNPVYCSDWNIGGCWPSPYDGELFVKAFLDHPNAVGLNGGSGHLDGVRGAINFECSLVPVPASIQVFNLLPGFAAANNNLRTKITGIPRAQWGDLPPWPVG